MYFGSCVEHVSFIFCNEFSFSYFTYIFSNTLNIKIIDPQTKKIEAEEIQINSSDLSRL
jgi:hypothetical protein